MVVAVWIMMLEAVHGTSDSGVLTASHFVRYVCFSVRIISKRRLREFWSDHPDAKEPLEAWYRVAKYAVWRNLAEARAVYPHADSVKGYTVFNIRGNTYRLIVKIEYALQIIFIRSLLTHNEYDRGVWK